MRGGVNTAGRSSSDLSFESSSTRPLHGSLSTAARSHHVNCADEVTDLLVIVGKQGQLRVGFFPLAAATVQVT